MAEQTNAKNEVTLEIDALSYGPYGIGRLNGKAVMIPDTAPGDTLVARIVESKERYSVAEVVRLVTLSPQRQTPPCPYVGSCGGCSWQHLRYDAQLKAKQQSVDDALQRIGKLNGFELRPIIPSPRAYRYRRRIRLQCNASKQLGFFRPSSHQLVEIASCDLAPIETERLLPAIRDWVARVATAIQYVEIVAGDEPNQTVIVAGAAGAFDRGDGTLCRVWLEEHPCITGMIMRGDGWRHAWGQTAVSVTPEDGVCLRTEGDVFTQINSDGNRLLLNKLLCAGQFGPGDRVLELYCGAGNFTLSIARRSREVIAVEASQASIENGKRSAELNGIDNIRWIRADVPTAVKRLKHRRERFTKIVLDPPRPGAPGIQAELAALGAQVILYVSCNPATLARDLSALAKTGYALQWVLPVDLFPHTFHVETLALMTQ
jgi:23S rRNA (uracil1939-C5)-methyltransferase